MRTQAERQNTAVWQSTSSMPTYPPPLEDQHADVCVIGGGIAGLTTAYLLSLEGLSVILLDSGPLAGGATAMTSAHLSNAIDDRYVKIERWHGAQGARLAAASHTAAIDRIEAIARQEKLVCDFERCNGYLFLGADDKEEFLDYELAAAHRAGLNGVTKLSRAPLPSFNSGPCLLFPNQAQFHPLKYLAGLAHAITRLGGRIFTHTHADKITGGSYATITTERFTITAKAVVVATNSPVNDLLVIHTKQAAYMSYVIGARVPHDSVPKGLYWDTQTPYHYVRLQQDEQPSDTAMLLVGGEDHKTGQANDAPERFARLETWARERFPNMGAVEYTWSGQVMETVDGLAFIGRNPMDSDNVFIVTGDSGMGLTHGTIAGMLLTDLIRGRSNPWETLYEPNRKTLRAADTFLGEMWNVATQYADWLTPSDVDSLADIGIDEGAVVRRGLTKLALYRDQGGKISACSAVCPHLGCIVHWNSADKTWDCPCHGSRFDKLGKVINGPANTDLAAVDE